MLKKFISSLTIFIFTLTLFIPNFTKVYAYDGNEPTTIFENCVTEKDKARIKQKNKLIAKYGVQKAYEMMGYKLVGKTKYNKELPTTNIAEPGGETGGILITSRALNCMWPENPSTRMATITVSDWKHYSSNEIDFAYEVSYNYPSFSSGLSFYDDMIAANFDGGDVYKYATSYSSSINSYKPATYGGGGYITDHSTYAYIIFVTKPRGGYTIDTAHGNAYMQFAKKSIDAPAGTSIGVGYGYASISYTIDTFWDYYCEINW